MDRNEYGYEEGEIKKENSKIFDRKISGEYKDFIANPLNKPLSEFEKDFTRIDTECYDLFNNLEQSLADLNVTIQDNPIYDDMDILNIIREALIKYKRWATALRRFADLGKEKMQEVNKISTDYYVSTHELANTYENLDTGVLNKQLQIVLDNPDGRRFHEGDKVRIMLIKEGK